MTVSFPGGEGGLPYKNDGVLLGNFEKNPKKVPFYIIAP